MFFKNTTTNSKEEVEGVSGKAYMAMYRWDTGTLSWVAFTGDANNGVATDVNITNSSLATKELPDSSSTYAPSNVTSTALEASHVIKASAGVLFSITGYNSKASAQYIQIHNTTSVPADTAVPVLVFRVEGLSNFSISATKFGRYFSTGITVCNSSTIATKTVGSADCWFDAQYI